VFSSTFVGLPHLRLKATSVVAALVAASACRAPAATGGAATAGTATNGGAANERATNGHDTIDAPPTTADWAALAKLPDWSGVWTPNWTDQQAQVISNPPPWKPVVAAKIRQMIADDTAGHPAGLFVNCLPEGMPSWMLISHNAMEFLFTPGRLTILGESDGNRLRRIYTDGRGHPPDPDPTFHGHSIGHWEGSTLVVDTVAVIPQAYIAVSEATGVPNNGDLHVIEHIHLSGPDTLDDDLEITAPRVLTGPWKTTRILFRQRARQYEIIEGVCLQGHVTEDVDADGNAVFLSTPQTAGGTPQLRGQLR
jgi:hypothetical protein